MSSIAFGHFRIWSLMLTSTPMRSSKAQLREGLPRKRRLTAESPSADAVAAKNVGEPALRHAPRAYCYCPSPVTTKRNDLTMSRQPATRCITSSADIGGGLARAEFSGR
jgi:hypothetical protein